MAGGRPGAAPDVAVVRALDGAVALSAGDGGHARLARRRVRALRGSIRRGRGGRAIALPLGAGTAVAEAREIDDAGHLRGPGADRRRDEHRGRGLGRH